MLGGCLRFRQAEFAVLVFLRVHANAVIARLIVAVLTATPLRSCHQEQCSPSVASACSTNRAGNASSRAARLMAGGPGIGVGARSPVSRRRFTHRLIVGSETSKTTAASRRDISPSTARTTRQRRASEYGFMPQA
jgi:hypothetical protein